MFTSRAEYRLLLREDNADLRLSELGYRIGLLPENRYAAFRAKRAAIDALAALLEQKRVAAGDALSEAVSARGGSPVRPGISWAELLRRPEVTVAMLREADSALAEFPLAVAEQVEISVKYEGYLSRQRAEADRLVRDEAVRIPEGFPYRDVRGLSAEVLGKFETVRPVSVGQAQRIPGVTPAAVALLLVALKRRG
jgi:tRNA uridine 5-carboxymethylaminomethyl modification enzyme